MKLRSSTYLIAVALVLLFVKLEAGVGNEDPRLDRYKLNAFLDEKFGINDDAISPEAVDQFEHMLNKLKVKQTQYRSEMGFLKHLFYTVHRKMLGDYVQYSSFQQIFEKHGYYDCVTASILYAIILDELNIQYEVRETDYHVYLLAIADDQEVFFETTDPMYGFVADPEEVMYRKNFYSGKIPNTEHRDEIIGLASENPEYQNTGHVDNALTFEHLPALQYYNQAIRQFNEGNIGRAYQLIKKAVEIHPTERIKNTASYIFSFVFEN